MSEGEEAVTDLLREVQGRVPLDAAAMLAREPAERVTQVLELLPAEQGALIAEHLKDVEVEPEAAALARRVPGTVDEITEPVAGVMTPQQTVTDALNWLAHSDEARNITYLYVADENRLLQGLIVIRDLIRARPEQTLDTVMLHAPFRLRQEMPIADAISAAVHRHYPVYPVCDGNGRLIGLVRGFRLFERQAIEITAQSGKMVGVDEGERVDTGVMQAFRMRHPWLQLNLLTAFVAAAVVSMFESTIAQVVALAAFLPVLAGQAGNTGSQAQAITLRGLTLGHLKGKSPVPLLRKEASLGALNGLLTGLVAAGAMWLFAGAADPAAPRLALVVLIAMVGSCVASGLAGVMVPLTLKRLGADPATASTIFLTTATDIVGMGLMLFLATAIVL